MTSVVRPEHRIQSVRPAAGLPSALSPNWQAPEVITQPSHLGPFDTSSLSFQIRLDLRPGKPFSESRHRRSSRALSAN
jgi:hypothetical protein